MNYTQIKDWIIGNKKLLAILLIAVVLRLYKLSVNPPHLTPDEAALGYNAFSILKTGRDEYGTLFPIIFKSFGDFKPGLYIYTTVPVVATLGLNEFAVRLPSALAGIVAIYLIYQISIELFKTKRIALLSALFLAISPWHIHFSRGAWEANLSLTLTLGGIYFFLKSFKKPKYLLVSSMLFALTLTTYQGAKLSTAIVLISLVVVFYKNVIKIKSSALMLSALIGIIIVTPVILSFFSGQTGRLAVFSIFSYPRPEEYLQTFLEQAEVQKGSLTYNAFYSEPLNFARGIMGRYYNHFSARFLFFEGDWTNPRHSAPYHGMLLVSDIALLITGIAVLFRKIPKRGYMFVLVWLLLVPLPAAFSRDQVHAIRSMNMIIPLALILAFGANLLLSKLKYHTLIIGGLTIYFLGFIYFLDAYFVHLPTKDSQKWDYGFKQIVQIVNPIKDDYKLVRIQQSFAQPYIYFLFHLKYDPATYQSQANLVNSEVEADVGKVEKLDNICFCPIDWSVNRGDTDTLFVADELRIPRVDSQDPELFEEIADIKYLNGFTAFRIIKVK